MKHTIKKIVFACMVIIWALTVGCLEKTEAPQDAQAGSPPPPPVDIMMVTAEPYTPTASLPGRIFPVRSARVCARVAGIVLNREFKEGSDVEKGQVLFRIDPAPFQATLAGAEAELARANAEFFDANTVFKRHAVLIKTGAVSTQQYDSAQANLKKAEAAIQAARAQIRTARLNLGYATVTAPISGRIGRALVTEGSLVGQGQATVMAKIQQLNPIYADFNQPVSDFLKLKAALVDETGVHRAASAGRATVSLTLEEIGNTRKGELLFADASVNAGTGQVSLRAQFPNHDGLLLPGMFVRIQTPLTQEPRAIFVPQRAVLRGTDGKARVMVVDAQGEASPRPVTTGDMRDGTWQITRGLTSGERIVTTGADKVRPGMVVAKAASGLSGQKLAEK